MIVYYILCNFCGKRLVNADWTTVAMDVSIGTPYCDECARRYGKADIEERQRMFEKGRKIAEIHVAGLNALFQKMEEE